MPSTRLPLFALTLLISAPLSAGQDCSQARGTLAKTTCTGDYDSPVQTVYGSSCDAARAALFSSLNNWANQACYPGTACNVVVAFKFIPASPGQCGITGSASYGCSYSGGGGGGGTGPFVPDP